MDLKFDKLSDSPTSFLFRFSRFCYVSRIYTRDLIFEIISSTNKRRSRESEKIHQKIRRNDWNLRRGPDAKLESDMQTDFWARSGSSVRHIPRVYRIDSHNNQSHSRPATPFLRLDCSNRAIGLAFGLNRHVIL